MITSYNPYLQVCDAEPVVSICIKLMTQMVKDLQFYSNEMKTKVNVSLFGLVHEYIYVVVMELFVQITVWVAE